MASRLAILRRDEWTCRMPVCLHLDESGQPDRRIDPELNGSGSPWAPTVDHIVPRALWGTNHPDNLRAAHARCNHHAAQGQHHRRAVKAPEPVRRGPWGGILQDPYDRLRQAERDRWAACQEPRAAGS